MTVFLPRENIFFLDEWLRYHIAVGFDHFYLYDNGGSRWVDCGNNLEVNARNKRGEEVYRLLADRDDVSIERELVRVLDPFRSAGYVTRIPWQPRDRSGQVTYGQAKAFMDYVRTYARDSEWVSFTDMDEFVVPVRHDSVRDVLLALESDGYTYVAMPQKCFASRFDREGRPVAEVLEIVQCADWVTTSFGPKAMVQADTLRIPWSKQSYVIHSPAVHRRRTRRITDSGLVRFNHYKFNQWELDWVANNLDVTLSLDAVDDGMRRFRARARSIIVPVEAT